MTPEYAQSRQGSQDLPLSSAWVAGSPAQPSLARGLHGSAHLAGLFVSGRDHGLVYTQGAGVAHLNHAGSRVLCRRTQPSAPQIRLAGDHEYGQGSQFTWFAWTDRLWRSDVRISMGGDSEVMG